VLVEDSSYFEFLSESTGEGKEEKFEVFVLSERP
jgi:hypothetical protein